MIEIVRSADRYHYQNDWLSTYWHFSFDHYYDPNNVSFGPLRVFNDDTIQPGKGFPPHDHKDMEILTYVLQGRLAHEDSTGGRGTIGPNEIQRMSAGTGVRHSEMNASQTEPVHLVQLWIQPARHGLPPSYEQLRFEESQRAGVLLPVASGKGLPGTVKIHQDATMYVSGLEPEQVVEYTMENAWRAYLFLAEGQLRLSGQSADSRDVVLDSGDVAKVTVEPLLRLEAVKPSHLVLLDLP